MRNIFPILTIVAAALLLPAVATAQDATDQRPDRSERRQRMIERFDADGDGQLNEEEKAKARDERGNKRGKAGRKGRGGGGRQGQAGRSQGPPDPMQVFDRFDENNDGQLSREEFMKLTSAMREMHERRGAGSQRDRGRAGRDGRRGPRREDGDRDRFRPLQNPGTPPLYREDQRQDDQRGFRGRDDKRGARDRWGHSGRRFEQMGPPNPERLFSDFDANGDDQLSREEFMQLTAEMRERMGRGGRHGFRRGPPEEGRPERPRRPDRPRRPAPPEFESVQPTEPAADDNSA